MDGKSLEVHDLQRTTRVCVRQQRPSISDTADKAVSFRARGDIVVFVPFLYEAGIEPLSRTGQHLLCPDGRTPAG
jgi:hypothetical protein